MKKWLAATVLSVLAISANAQEEPVIFPLAAECNTFEYIKDFLNENYGEVPVASGTAVVQALTTSEFYKTRQYIFANPKTYTFSSVIYFEEDSKACVVSMGSEFGPVIQDDGI
jgi:hypothetical protein